MNELYYKINYYHNRFYILNNDIYIYIPNPINNDYIYNFELKNDQILYVNIINKNNLLYENFYFKIINKNKEYNYLDRSKVIKLNRWIRLLYWIYLLFLVLFASLHLWSHAELAHTSFKPGHSVLLYTLSRRIKILMFRTGFRLPPFPLTWERQVSTGHKGFIC